MTIDHSLEHLVSRAQAGERAALEAVIRAIQPDVHKLALRFLTCPQDAADASQEILVRVITHLSTFRGDSAFRTWVYRVASNSLMGVRKQRKELADLTFDRFAAELGEGWSEEFSYNPDPAVESLLLEEVKIGCTLAMLQCLDRGHRLAYILGEIMELEHGQAASVLAITPSAYRKRLSRARKAIVTFMHDYCGLVNTDSACRCRRRVSTAIASGRVDPANLRFATSPNQARQFPQLLRQIRQLEDAQRAAALYQSHPMPHVSRSFADWLRRVLENTEMDSE